MNPVEEFLQIKQAGKGGGIMRALGKAREAIGGSIAEATGHPLSKALGWGLATSAGIGLGYGVGGIGAEKLYDAATKSRDFKQMMEANPHLQAYQKEDPAGFGRMFSALRRMNPEFSREPLVAGAYMHEAMETPPEERGMVAVKALQAAKPLPVRPIREVAGMGAAQFARGMGSLPKEPGPVQVGSTERVWEPGRKGLVPGRQVERSFRYGPSPTG